MKHIISTISLVFISCGLFAQAPEKMTFQAVVRDSANDLVVNQNVSVRISILKGNASGIANYMETHTKATNENGLLSIEIGTGTVIGGNFTTIDWGSDNYFLNTEFDPNGGTNYSIIGTSQLMSVPYALYAKTAENFSGTLMELDPIFAASPARGILAQDTTNWNSKLDSYTETDPIFGGSTASGITPTDTANWNDKMDSFIEVDPMFFSSTASGINNTDTIYWNNKLDSFVETDPHFTSSLAAGITAMDTANWNNIDTDTQLDSTDIANMGFVTSGLTVESYYLGQDTLGGIVFYIYKDGSGNQHGLIVSKTENTATWQEPGTLTGASRTEDGTFNTALMSLSPAANFVLALGPEWYIPSLDELSLLFQNRYICNKALRTGGSTLISATAQYWSSTEYSANVAFYFSFFNGTSNYNFKNTSLSIRGIKSF